MAETKQADQQFDVLTVGNAIVDIIARAEDDFLVREDIAKAAMNLIDADRAEHLYSVMGPAIEASGGSAGNTAVGVASLGGSAAYFGKVADDYLGQVFTHDIRAIGVHFDTPPLLGKPPTARSMMASPQLRIATSPGAISSTKPANGKAHCGTNPISLIATVKSVLVLITPKKARTGTCKRPAVFTSTTTCE